MHHSVHNTMHNSFSLGVCAKCVMTPGRNQTICDFLCEFTGSCQSPIEINKAIYCAKYCATFVHYLCTVSAMFVQCLCPRGVQRSSLQGRRCGHCLWTRSRRPCEPPYWIRLPLRDKLMQCFRGAWFCFAAVRHPWDSRNSSALL